ncbi:MAG: hypothetical protein AAF682_28185 [Planctomycetota bacterium]
MAWLPHLGAWLATLAASLAALQAGDEAPQDPPLASAGKRRPVAGLAGLKAESAVRFLGRAADPHRLEVTFLFPDRARWALRHDASGERTLQYRYGEHAFVLPRGEREAPTPTAAERAAMLRPLELRRAAFLWPAGFDWSGEGAVRTAPLRTLSDGGQGAPLGSLRADLAPDGRPRRLAVLDPHGVVQEELLIRAWTEQRGRTWPGEMRLIVGGREVWEETLSKITTRLDRLEGYFLPPNHQGLAPASDAPQPVRLEQETTRIVPLDPAAGWALARERAAELVRSEAPALRDAGHDLRALPSFRLDAQGRPTGVVLRLKALARPAPEGFASEPATPALRMALDGATEPTPEALARLRAAIPAGYVEAGLRAEATPSRLTLELRLAQKR